MRVRAFATLAMIAGLLCPAQAWGQARSIDSRNSKLIVRVYKAGLFSAFGDNHEVGAPISEGVVDEAAARVSFVVDARGMKVLDPQLSADKRRQVQERMLGPDVLDTARFPTIKFESTSVERAGPGRLLVRGQLLLHGVARPVVANVRIENGRYLGSSTLKQRDFGITPVNAAGGTIKVKDELTIEFDIGTSTQAAVLAR